MSLYIMLLLCILYYFKKAILTCVCNPWPWIVTWMFAVYQTHYHWWLSAISVTWWVCWLAIQTFVHSCVLETLLYTKQAAHFKQWPSINVMSRIMVPSTYQIPKNRGSPWSGNIGCSNWRGSGAEHNIEGLQQEGNLGVQSDFLKDVQSLTVVTQYMDNQCLEKRIDIWVLDVGQDQYSRCVDEPLSKCVTTVTDPLSNNKPPLFSYPAVKGPSKGSLQLMSMKSDCNVFSRLYLAFRQDMVIWLSSSVMEIILAHYLCHWEANCGLGQMQIHCLNLK